MHASSVTGFEPAHTAARHGSAAAVAAALQASRGATLATFSAFEQVLPGLQVPQAPYLNPPLWELGHVGWFQNHWLARQPAGERARGHRADALAPRLLHAPGHRAEADAWYDSSRVAHATRWQLPLPTADATRRDLAAGLAATLELLADQAGLAGDGDGDGDAGADGVTAGAGGPAAPRADALYFFRLALLHEDMHHEAALYMAQALGVPMTLGPSASLPPRRPKVLPAPAAPLHFEPRRWRAGVPAGEDGFAFDNECGAQEVALVPFEIDPQVLRWAEYLPFVEAGGYHQARWWTPAGWAWRAWREAGASPAAAGPAGARAALVGAAAPDAPRYLRHDGAGWWVWRQGVWARLDLAEPACHLSLHEAQAWCAWAGRRLPTEFEWECAALTRPEAFAWGEVWEWTASPFAPFGGFEPHPYREYSAPWFDGRPVLKGASFMTQPRMRHPRYRNFFEAHRNDVPAGLRSCAA